MIDLFKYSNEKGLPLPLAHDPVQQQASVTMFFAYLTNLLAIASLIYYNIAGDHFNAACLSCVYAIIHTILFMFKHLRTFKADLDDKSIELEGSDENSPSN